MNLDNLGLCMNLTLLYGASSSGNTRLALESQAQLPGYYLLIISPVGHNFPAAGPNRA